MAWIVPLRSASMVSGSAHRSRVMSRFGARPATWSSRSASTSVPELGEPVETVLPLMSSIRLIPESVRTMTCV
jgi:hypothetical protein